MVETLAPEQRFILDLLALFAPYVMVVLSLNLEYGFGGIPDFGRVLAVAGGAFIVGYLPGRLAVTILGLGNGFDPTSYVRENARLMTEVNRVLAANPALAISLLALGLVAAALLGALLGLLLSYPVVRLRAEFLAMVLLAVAELLLLIGRNYPPLVGGTLGVAVPDVYAWSGGNRFVVATLTSLAVAALVFTYVQLLTRSPLGRLLRAIRDDEGAALAYGKDVAGVRVKTFMASCSIAAIAGAIYAFYTASVNSLAYNRVTWTFWPWVMVILGGAANNLGVVVGTFIFVAVRKLIIYYKYELAPILPFDVVWLDMLLLGVALAVILLYRPEGIIPERPIRTLPISRLSRAAGRELEGAPLASKLWRALSRLTGPSRRKRQGHGDH